MTADKVVEVVVKGGVAVFVIVVAVIVATLLLDMLRGLA